LAAFYEGLSDGQKAGIEAVSMDMWPAYLNATRDHVPGAEDKIAFDRFHVAKLLGEAVDQVRRQEHRQLRAQGCEDLKGSRYVWLTDPANMTAAQKERFQALRQGTLKTARALTIKAHLWGILNAIVLKQSNGHAEGMNSRIQRIKQRACRFRNKDRFRNAIYFHLGGLELYPEGIRTA